MIVVDYDENDVLYLVRNLENFEKDKSIKNGIRVALNVFKRKGQSNLLERMLYHGKHTGALENSFLNHIKRNSLGGLVGFRRSTKWVQYENAGNHAHLVDRGTAPRYTKNGSYRGIMPANHFWTDAFESEKIPATEKLLDAVRINVERINARR
jgi:Bacteriophage protein of unknown function (DUF646).